MKKARDEFFTLLELSPEIQTGMRYSKALAVFEDEPRWKVPFLPLQSLYDMRFMLSVAHLELT